MRTRISAFCVRSLHVLSTALLLAAALIAPGASAAPRNTHVDTQWVHPEFDRAGVRAIGILPGVTFDGNYQASRAVAALWSTAVPDSGYVWIGADEVLRRVEAAGMRDVLDRRANDEIRKSGHVEPATAQLLCRALRTNGLLCLRVDKWEAMLAADSRHSASVEIRAALVDSAGTELWRISGRSMYRGMIQAGPQLEFEGSSRAPGATRPTASSSGGSSGGTSGGSSSGSGGGSSGSGGGGGGGASGGSSGSPAAGSSMPSTGSGVNEATTGHEYREVWVRSSLAPDTPAEFQSALSSLFSDWVPLLPAPKAPKR